MLVVWFVASMAVSPAQVDECNAVHPLDHSAATPRSDLRTLYSEGKTYLEFRDAATRRVQAWNDHYAQAQVPDALQTRMAALPSRWHLLVVAEDWCGDSANTIPYVAKLVDVAGNLDMRIVDSEVGRGIMEAHRTPDDRAATPTVILLTNEFEEAGCFVERPRVLQNWFLASEDKLSRKSLLDQKYAWYDEDRGRETLEEIVGMIEAAARGDRVC